MTSKKKRTCPSGKVRFPDRQSAVHALHKIRNNDRRQVTPVRAYMCPLCHGAHLTHQKEH